MLCGALGLAVMPAGAQGFIDQQAVEAMLEVRASGLAAVPAAAFAYYDLYGEEQNGVLARNRFYKHLGRGDADLGRRRARLVELLNRVELEMLAPGDTVVVPDTFGVDFRAYAPFPRVYDGARDFDKLVVIDKAMQVWAAYAGGELERWGVVSTGAPETPTPSGRFNFNWKEPYRVSLLSPDDEPWEMYWVFNFHNKRGIHVHQYDVPTDGPTSHGCVRLVDADARWIYEWADAWATTAPTVGYASHTATVRRQGTTVLVLGTEPPGRAHLFADAAGRPVLRQVLLPAHPYDVPPGTDQQKHFDRLRGRRPAGGAARTR